MQSFFEYSPREIFTMIIEEIPLSFRVSLPLVNRCFNLRMRALLVKPSITILEDIAKLEFSNLFLWMIGVLKYPNCAITCEKALSAAASGLRKIIKNILKYTDNYFKFS